MSSMKTRRRKSPVLTIRLTAPERAEIDRAAAAEHLSSSTWLRRLALLAAEEQKRADGQRQRMAVLAARVRSRALPRAAEHASEVERSREDWTR